MSGRGRDGRDDIRRAHEVQIFQKDIEIIGAFAANEVARSRCRGEQAVLFRGSRRDMQRGNRGVARSSNAWPDHAQNHVRRKERPQMRQRCHAIKGVTDARLDRKLVAQHELPFRRGRRHHMRRRRTDGAFWMAHESAPNFTAVDVTDPHTRSWWCRRCRTAIGVRLGGGGGWVWMLSAT